MITDLEKRFSINSMGMKRSAIRELLKLTEKPEVISFAGGLPSPESFPINELKGILNEMMETEGALALQYGATEGDTLLRDLLIKRYKEQEGLDIPKEELIVVTASQQGLDLVAKVFINRGDIIIAGLPSYLGALSAFNSYGAQMIGVELDNEGMRADLLEETMKKLTSENKKPKFIYTIPDFQNPAGVTMSLQRRKDILAIAKKYDLIILEDSPYRELRYDGETLPTLLALDDEKRVINLGTFSKIFAPGFRIGWVVANATIIDKIVVAKQATDLCTPAFTQRLAARYIQKGLLEPKIEFIRNMYRVKRDGMHNTLLESMPEEIKWVKPDGGLFLFLTCPEKVDCNAMFAKALEQNVAYVSGNSFFCNGKGGNTMRLNFSYCSLDKNVEGIKRLAKVLKAEL